MQRQSHTDFVRALGSHGPQRAVAQFTLLPAAAAPDASGQPGEAYTYCILGSWLLGAIHIEHRLAYDTAGMARARQIALASPDHSYRFQDPEALDNLPQDYSQAQLERARAALAPLTDTEIRAGFAEQGKLHALYAAPEPERKFAVACALIERGYAPGVMEGGMLRVDDNGN